LSGGHAFGFLPLISSKLRLCVGLCDFWGLGDESDHVSGLEQVLGDGGHDHLPKGFRPVKVACALQVK
jgi:hypothetical protein